MLTFLKCGVSLGPPASVRLLCGLVQVAMAGFTEVLTWVLHSHEENFRAMNLHDDGKTAVTIGNPRSADFEVHCRPCCRHCWDSDLHAVSLRTGLPRRGLAVSSCWTNWWCTQAGPPCQDNRGSVPAWSTGRYRRVVWAASEKVSCGLRSVVET
jgi:hypothetical protein